MTLAADAMQRWWWWRSLHVLQGSFASGSCGGQRISQRGLPPPPPPPPRPPSTQSGLTTSISIITAATKPLAKSAASAQSSVFHTLSSGHLCWRFFLFIRGLKGEVNLCANLSCLEGLMEPAATLRHTGSGQQAAGGGRCRTNC